MIQKDGSIIITDWHKGISPSPYYSDKAGFADMRNVDPFTIPGVLMLAKAATNKTATTIASTPRYCDMDSATSLYVLCTDGKLYKGISNGTSWSADTGHSAATGKGLKVYRDGLLLAAGTGLHVKQDLTGTPAWQNSGNAIAQMTLDSADHHTMFETPQDGKLNIANGNYVNTVNAAGTGDLDITTATFVDNAIDFPTKYKMKALEAVGNNLLTAGYAGSTIFPENSADIFPWDRSSTSYTDPIKLGEAGVNVLKTINDLLYIQAGYSGRWYISNGSSSRLLFAIPNLVQTVDTPHPQGVMYMNGRLYFAVRGSEYLNSSNGRSGVYSVNPDGTGLILENTISTGVTDYNVDIGFLFPGRAHLKEYFIGWRDETTNAQGVDRVSVNEDYIGSYGGYVDSQVYTVGTALQPKTFQKLEIYLDRPLNSNEGIRISTRTNMASSFTTFGTYTSSNFTSNFHRVDFPIRAEQVQVRIALLGAGSGASATCPRLKYIKLI